MSFFLNKLFSLWYRDVLQGNRISIRYFDNLLGIILGYRPQSCDLYGSCSNNLVLESNGDIYPCDFYVIDNYKLGNIIASSIAEIINSKNAKEFISLSRIVSPKCKKCQFYQLCRGGCRRHRQSPIDDIISENIFCRSYYSFLEKNISKLEHLALLLSN